MLPEWELSAQDPRPDSEWLSPPGPAVPSPIAPPPSQSLRVAVPTPRVPGDAVSDRGTRPVREIGGERSGPWAGGGERELMDLRLHAPRPDVVIVRVSGPVDGLAARLLADRVGKQLHRALHVVIDLGDVSVLDRRGLTVLLTLHQQALARGTQLHLVGAEHDAVCRPLQATGLAQLLSLESTADAVIAALPRPLMSRVGTGRIEPDPDDADPAGGLGQDHARPIGPAGEHGPPLRSANAIPP